MHLQRIREAAVMQQVGVCHCVQLAMTPPFPHAAPLCGAAPSWPSLC